MLGEAPSKTPGPPNVTTSVYPHANVANYPCYRNPTAAFTSTHHACHVGICPGPLGSSCATRTACIAIWGRSSRQVTQYQYSACSPWFRLQDLPTRPHGTRASFYASEWLGCSRWRYWTAEAHLYRYTMQFKAAATTSTEDQH
jgi:hypothetical protein